MTAPGSAKTALRASPAAARCYQLRLSPSSGRLCARIERQGPADLLPLMRGRSVAEAVRLAGLLFPVCPRAHQAAMLRAMEAALHIDLAPAQAAAREIAVRAEAIAAGVWREALTWPALFGDAPDAESVRRARAASDDILQALYAEDWARTGGAPLTVRTTALQPAVACLRASFDALRDRAASYLERQSAAFAVSLNGIAPLGDALWRTDPAESAAGLEETPRALLGGAVEGPVPLRAWYTAQHRHIQQLADGFPDLLDALCAAAAPRYSEDADGSGAGLGVAMTARGRLRHGVTIEHGHIADWRAMAPTDWNFAPNGPVALAARSLPVNHDLEACGRALIAAFDPCAPCDVAIAPESREAANDA